MKETTNITEAEYKMLRSKYDTYHSARKELCGTRNYVTPEEQKILPESPTHDEISSIEEVYEFRHDVPERYFAYVHQTKYLVGTKHDIPWQIPTHITTWTGEIIGEVIGRGLKYRSNMGDVRINIRVKAINGREYSGTYFFSAGDYCRLKLCK